MAVTRDGIPVRWSAVTSADVKTLQAPLRSGLVALELLLRHRAKRVVIVCPPGLMTKWQDEMAVRPRPCRSPGR